MGLTAWSVACTKGRTLDPFLLIRFDLDLGGEDNDEPIVGGLLVDVITLPFSPPKDSSRCPVRSFLSVQYFSNNANSTKRNTNANKARIVIALVGSSSFFLEAFVTGVPPIILVLVVEEVLLVEEVLPVVVDDEVAVVVDVSVVPIVVGDEVMVVVIIVLVAVVVSVVVCEVVSEVVNVVVIVLVNDVVRVDVTVLVPVLVGVDVTVDVPDVVGELV